jgi:hypothetical protein
MQSSKPKPMFRNNAIAILLLLGFVSCNPVGEKIEEIGLKANEITSAEGVDLKKGDVVTIWSKVSTNNTMVSPNISLRYNIENKDESLKNDSIHVAGGSHIINSSKSEESYQTSDSNEKDSTVYYTKWEYEAENASFTAPRDGKYNFDFKLRYTGEGFLRDEISVILRKKN